MKECNSCNGIGITIFIWLCTRVY